MPSSRALGIIALSAVILATVSFAAVDVSIADANACTRALGSCVDAGVPAAALGYAIIGTIALLVSVLPAITWFIQTIHHAHHDADIEPMRMAIVRRSLEEDDL